MTGQAWQRTWEVFEAAAELPPEKRSAYVTSELPEPELAARVFEMLGRLSDSADSLDPAAPSQFSEPLPQWTRLGATVGRFQITAALGRGGMGEVYEALDTELQRKAAIKFLAYGRFGSTTGIDRFRREAQAASSLNHPNVVTVYEVLRMGPDMAIVMELVDGDSLRRFCAAPLPPADVVRLGSQIAQALQVAHAAGIVHRDIKPENLMVRRDGLVKILDFGLARHMAGDTHSSSLGLPVGTLRYMSPEQIRGESATPASDIFALGLVLYELSTGAHPFAAESALATTHRIAGESAAPASAVVRGFDPEVETLLIQMLQRDPGLRPAAADVASRLAGWGAAKPPVLAAKRSAWRWGAAAACAAVLGFAIWAAASPKVSAPEVIASSATQIANLTPLTNLPGDEIDPDFSPDGKRIAYAWNGGSTGDQHDIYVRGLGVEDSTRLSTDAADEFSPVWSPDGRQIAYLRSAGDSLQVVVVGAEGKDERVVTSATTQSALKKRLAWANSEALILGDDAPGTGDALRFYRVSLETGERRRIVDQPSGSEDLSPSLSPDGRYLAFVRAMDNRRDVWVTGADGSAPRRLVESNVNIHSIDWAADSRSVYFVQADRSNLIQRRGLDGSTGPDIRVEGAIRHFTMTSGGRLAYFRRLSDGNIWRYSPQTSGRTKVLDSTVTEDDPRIGPRSGRITFASDRGSKGSVWVMNPDGSGSRPVVAGMKGYSGSPSWSPDETWIAFDGSPKGSTEIFAVRLADGYIRTLASGYMPLFSRTNPWIYFTKKVGTRNEIWKVGTEGGEPVQVTANGGLEARESPAGDWLYYSKPTTPGIFRRRMDGGPEGPIAGVQPFGRYWDVGEKGIYYLAAGKLWLHEVSGGRTRELAQLARPMVSGPRGLAVAPDGSVLFVQFDTYRREIILADVGAAR